MANNYCSSSSFLKLEKEQLEKVSQIIDKVVSDIEDVSLSWAIGSDGILFYEEECFEPEMLAEIVEKILEELKVNKPFLFTWAYYCDKPRIDEFGGGACLIQMGYETKWYSPMEMAHDEMKARG